MEAATCLRLALDINPRSALAYYKLGNIQRLEDNDLDAVSSFEMAIELDRGAARNDLLRRCRAQAWVCEFKEKWNCAIEAYEAWIRLYPKWAEPHVRLARVYAEEKEDTTHAIMILQSAIDAQPDSFWPYLGLGDIYRSQGESEMALNYYREAMSLEIIGENSTLRMIDLLISLGRLDDALEILNAELTVNPDSVHLHSRMEWVRQLKGQQ